MKKTRTFKQLVDIAYCEIIDAIDNCKGWDFIEDFVKETNWSEICSWCKFPDLQTSESIYERAINMAIFMILADKENLHKVRYEYLREHILNCWQNPSKISNYEAYDCDGDKHLVINGIVKSIPIDYYNAIKEGKL